MRKAIFVLALMMQTSTMFAQTSAKTITIDKLGSFKPATTCSPMGTQGCPGQPIGALCVALSWTPPVTPPAVATINIYRGTSSGGEGNVPYATVPATQSSYQDNTIPAGAANLYYVAAAVGTGGLKSVLSNESCAQVPVPTNPPTNLQSVPNSN